MRVVPTVADYKGLGRTGRCLYCTAWLNVPGGSKSVRMLNTQDVWWAAESGEPGEEILHL